MSVHLAGDGPPDSALLGGKGAGLWEARRLGLRVPAFAILDPREGDRARDLEIAIAALERETDLRLGDPRAPLIVSVRSSPAVSMPGILDTVLDVGASAHTALGLADRLGDRVAALDVRRRFLESWGTVVRRMPRSAFDALDGARVASRASVMPRPARTEGSVLAVIARHEANLGAIPEDPREQLRQAIDAVIASWDLERARDFRRAHGIDDALGMAVIVQAMVFGNAGGASGSGVAFTRSPVDGAKHLFGEFLPCAQGDEVVGGRASPAGLSAAASGRRADESLERVCPAAFAELERIARLLEGTYGDAQDIEFTLERETLWILQARTAKRTPHAAIRIAVDLVREGRIDRDAALARVDPALLGALARSEIAPSVTEKPLTVGLPASPGAISGRVVFDAADAIAARDPVILVRSECGPEDAPGIRAAAGVLTSSGGLTAHAAVIARALGRPCIVSASEVRVDARGRKAEVREPFGSVVPLPPTITLDGVTGRVFAGVVPLRLSLWAPEAYELLGWARERGSPGWADAIARYLG